MLMLPSCVKEIPRFDWSIQSYAQVGSGCDSVGRAVASDTRGLRFKSSHRQILFTINCIEKKKIKNNIPGMAQFEFFLKKAEP